MKGKHITGKQQAFADEWMDNGFNATRAAMVANYAPLAINRRNVCQAIGAETLAKPIVKAYITEKQALRAKEAGLKGITAEQLLDDLVELKNTCIGKGDSTGANKAIDSIGKHIGFFEADNAQKTVTFQQLLVRMGDGNEV